VEAGPYSAQKLSKSSHLFRFETNKEHPREDVGGGRPVGSQVAMGPASPFLPGPRGLSVGTSAPGRPQCCPPSGPAAPCRSRMSGRAAGPRGTPAAPGSGPRSPRGAATAAGAPGCPAAPSRPSAPLHPLRHGRPRPAAASPLQARTGHPRAPARPPRDAAFRWRRSAWCRRARPHPRPAAPAASTPEPGRRQGLFRCCSQPCVRAGGKGRRKHGRAEDARWPRPALDFLKMARTLKTSKSLCPLGYKDEDEEDARVRTALSSPWPCCWATGEGEGGSGGDPGDWASAGEEGVLPLGPGELDLEQMESS
ncbi:hypothetical protein FD754_020196, partial [Muntiacus muntjak]